ncbi:MAG: branched-chain amino acid ABC transporter permease [Chloroflexi bacterium]|nr:branched-chain amino acid ABC transporter permease [Chloroflexota bacterium]
MGKIRVTPVMASLIALGIVALLLPHVLGVYYLHVVNVALVNIILAVGLNFILGFGGQISLAQAAFFGLGAYGYSILALRNVALPVAAVAGVVFAAVAGLALGWPALKLKGHYLALATLGFGIIMQQFMINLSGLTGGANGLSAIPRFSLGPMQLDSEPHLFYVELAFAALVVTLSVLFNRSPLGMRARAVRDDETAAEVAGVNIRNIKVMLFVISASCGGLAGVLYSTMLGYISPDVFAWSTTFNYLVMVVIGGLGSTGGVVVMAFLLTLLPEWLRFLKDSYMAVFGLVVIIMMAAAPGGLAGLVRAVSQRQKQSGFRLPRSGLAKAILSKPREGKAG